MTLYLAGLLVVAGLMMLLYGVGRGRCGYVLVFLSFLLCLFAALVIPALDDKGSPVILGGIVAFITNRLVRQFYRRRDSTHDKPAA